MYYLGVFIDDERDPHQVTWVTYPDKIVWHDTIRTYKDFKKFLTLSKSDKKKQTT
jgi:Leu/Phe-tRNA-protein transferase